MKKHHKTIVLAIIFLCGLIVLWWAGPTGVDTELTETLLPALGKAPIGDVKRIEIVQAAGNAGAEDEDKGRGGKATRIVLERRDGDRWQMVEPVDVAADPSAADTLARNLQILRKSADAGTIHDPPGRFGLAPPEATIRVFGGADGKTALGALDVGMVNHDQRYVRVEGGEGIEVVDPSLLSMVGLRPVEWRDRSLFHLPTFQVRAFQVEGPGRQLRAERDQGHWQLVRPVPTTADDDKVEGMVAELTSLRVARGNEGFIAEGKPAASSAKFGLEPPSFTIAIEPAPGAGPTQTLVVGAADPEHPGMHFARAGDQDDVVLIDARNFEGLGLDPNALRGKKVARIDPAAVEFVRIRAVGHTFDLARAAKGWTQLQPTREVADELSVGRLLSALESAETGNFLDPKDVKNPGLEPPQMTIEVWQAAPRTSPARGLAGPPSSPPRLALEVGNYDPLLKSIYGRIEGDRTILTIPQALIDDLPQTKVAFRDRSVLTIGPGEVARLAVHREGTTIELAVPPESSKSTSWRMVGPVAARADEEAVTRALLVLSNLRAESYVTDQVGDGKEYGFQVPKVTVSWTLAENNAPAGKATADPAKPAPRGGTLRVGSKRKGTEQYYANLEGSPVVFTLAAPAIAPFDAEFHDHRIFSFKPGQATRMVLTWPGRTLACVPQEDPGTRTTRWVPEPGTDAPGFDLSRLNSLLATLGGLSTPRFLQYNGPIPEGTGLDPGFLSIEVQLAGDDRPRFLRLGKSNGDQTFATNARDKTGPVFLLTGPAWPELARRAPGSAPAADAPSAVPPSPAPKAP
jgi:hypothetical protein